MRHDWDITASTIESQRKAADPAVSAWVSANAGSGKTHVLANRVVRLLLDGVAPNRILCLTYTKAAAANMSSRVFDLLGNWTHLDDDGLAGVIEAMEGTPPAPDRLARARRLFAEALETPGGLKIQTIHAFCEAVLHQFSLEAGIAGHFEMMDTAMEAALLTNARQWLLSRATDGNDTALFGAFDHVMARAGETGLDRLLSDIVRQRDELTPVIADRKSAMTRLRAYLGIDDAMTEETVIADALPPPGWDRRAIEALRGDCQRLGAKRPADFCERLIDALSEHDPSVRFQSFASAFSKGEEPYSAGWLFGSKVLGERGEAFVAGYEAAVAHIVDAQKTINTLDLLDATEAALTLAEALLDQYERSKIARGLLDFSDLLTRTADLLTRNRAAAWVQYKLDKGIDHLLIDEAQDTSPRQWQVIEALAAEFFSGEGAGDGRSRTIFAVGDEKQSIYSFQGARPGQFSDAGTRFGKHIASAEKPFAKLQLRQSFRSTPDILSAVDRTFATADARKGLTRDDEPVEHETVRNLHAGDVALWSYLAAEQAEAPARWVEGLDPSAAPAARLADEVAGQISHWLDRNEKLPGKDRAMRAGDVLVLVRKRDRFIHALARSLKQRGVPVAGTDRLHLSDHIAVQDLIAIGRFVQQPNDDLALAGLLKSPLFGLDDENLMALLLPRDTRSLWQRLRQIADTGVRYAAAADQLQRWRDEAGYRTPADFFGAVLGRDGGRRKLIARLGAEASEVIDEFQRFVMAQERLGLTDLERVVDALSHSAPEIKREMEQGRDEVRIMTVHASKGLEAPIVFLVDSGGAPSHHSHLSELMKLPLPASGRDRASNVFLWKAPALGTQPQIEKLKNLALTAQEEEYRRLLYVGMTRAEDRLIVCGYRGKTEPKQPTWLNLVQQGLEASGEGVILDDHPVVTTRDVLHYAPSGHSPLPMTTQSEAKSHIAIAGLPFDPSEQLPAPDPAPRPLSPSGAGDLLESSVEVAQTEAAIGLSPILGAGREPLAFPIRKGLAVHRLLELLADIAQADRENAARRWLTYQDFTPSERDAICGDVLSTLAQPDFAAAFAPGSRAEVSIAGLVDIKGKPRSISGIIDRLAISEREILIVDFKTNAAIPGDEDEVADDYALQMSLYRALLQRLYPGRAIRCALVFTGGPRLITLSEKRLTEASRLIGLSVSGDGADAQGSLALRP
ncbi:double-strand break repair helicase AddA [Notoacmeibacter sp. MSK16QG-6]|uniref:double-strand break repair helicase AddA n=1 Tax=Notoacmeibacter sp. MSK16QG-6 TaxID=2957982 RepID=UPI00209E7EA2|nr:double-strand break repair helicase AddA [Notoacmeibacter sp. MSK16QG-6]MCP1199014.1 double-strand break repair helicase AddA [Notoacmeibacter sp. MSK16QG-6]